MKMNHVPYRGSGQATTDLLGGAVAMSIPGTAGMVGHIKAGKLRALAVTGATRSPQLPDVPTVMEAGVPGYEAYVWMGLLAPKGTPPAIVERLNREVLAVLAEPTSRNTWRPPASRSSVRRPRSSARSSAREKNLWAKVIRDTGAQRSSESDETRDVQRNGCVTGNAAHRRRACKASSTGRRKSGVRLFLWEKFVGSPDGQAGGAVRARLVDGVAADVRPDRARPARLVGDGLVRAARLRLLERRHGRLRPLRQVARHPLRHRQRRRRPGRRDRLHRAARAASSAS